MLRKLFKNAGVPAAFGGALLIASTASQAASYWTAGTFGTAGADALATVQAMNAEYIPLLIPITFVLALPYLVKKGIKAFTK